MVDDQRPLPAGQTSAHPSKSPWKVATLAILATIALLIGGVLLLYKFARNTGEAATSVMRDFRDLAPATTRVPEGSVVVAEGDTVGILTSVATLRSEGPGLRSVRLFKGRWTETAGTMQGDTALVGLLSERSSANERLLIRLVREGRDRRIAVGQMLLEPGVRPVPVYEP